MPVSFLKDTTRDAGSLAARLPSTSKKEGKGGKEKGGKGKKREIIKPEQYLSFDFLTGRLCFLSPLTSVQGEDKGTKGKGGKGGKRTGIKQTV